MATKPIKSESTPRGLQKALVGGVVGAYLIQTAVILTQIMQPTNQNLSAYYITVAQLILTPLIIMVVAWLLNPRKLTKLGRVFESTLTTIVGMMFISVVGQAMVLVPLSLDTPMLFTVIPVVATLVYIAALASLRATKIWK